MAYVDTVGDILRVTIAATQPGPQIQEMNHHFLCLGTGGADSRNAIGSMVFGAYITNYLSVMSSASGLYGFKVSLLNRPPLPSPSISATPSPGTGGGTPCPTQARPLLRWTSAIAGRRGRGRTYLPTPDAGGITATGFPAIPVNVGALAVSAALLAGYAAGGAIWALTLARRTAGPPVTWSSTPLSGGLPTGKFATQRKSGNYGKINDLPW